MEALSCGFNIDYEAFKRYLYSSTILLIYTTIGRLIGYYNASKSIIELLIYCKYSIYEYAYTLMLTRMIENFYSFLK